MQLNRRLVMTGGVTSAAASLFAIRAGSVSTPAGPPASDPPECGGCLFWETPADLSHRLIIFPERTAVERVHLRGIVFESDGRTPARDVIMYAYHTDETGTYSKRGDEPRDSYAWWHGKQRGWLRTNARGEYEIETIRPAPYPTRDEPAHIHAVVKAPSQKHETNIADFVFVGDPLLTPRFWRNTADWWRGMGIYQDPNYGGVTLRQTAAGMWQGERNITLPAELDLPSPDSGRAILSENPAFKPQHVWGPDRGTATCPMSVYGDRPGVLYWVNSDTDWAGVRTWASWLDELSNELGRDRFKGYLIYTNPARLSDRDIEARLSSLGQELGLSALAVTYVTSVEDKKSGAILNAINPNSTNTFIVHNNRTVTNKFVNFSPSTQSFALLRQAVRRAERDAEMFVMRSQYTLG